MVLMLCIEVEQGGLAVSGILSVHRRGMGGSAPGAHRFPCQRANLDLHEIPELQRFL